MMSTYTYRFIQVRQAEENTSYKFLSSQIWVGQQRNNMLPTLGKDIQSVTEIDFSVEANGYMKINSRMF